MASYRLALLCSYPPLYSYLLSHSMVFCCRPISVYHLWKCSHILCTHVSLVTISPARKVPRTSACQNIEIVDGISLRQGRPV